VTDFIKPVAPANSVSLTIVVDAPLALDYLGCSGKALKDDVRGVFTALKGIGCSFVVFPVSCTEMRRNLQAMLDKPPHRRHGYTHQAIARGEVLPDFVAAVVRDPETMLENAGIQVKHLSLDQYPHSHTYFDAERYEDFLSTVNWVQDMDPREHDATCLALLMRLREGKHHSDVFRSRYIFVTRNTAFAKASRDYLLKSRLVGPAQQGPIVPQRELATIAWLRTGLGADDRIPRSHLLASCERVLRVRPEVQEAVASKLAQVTPDKLEQFELLLQDHRSVRALADETLNDERVVTDENAERLLEVMRQAAIAEERERHAEQFRETRARHAAEQKKSRATAALAEADRDAWRAKVIEIEVKQQGAISRLVQETNRATRLLERVFATVLLSLGALGLIELGTGWLTNFMIWNAVLMSAGIVGGYHLLMDVLEKPKVGFMTALNWLARWTLVRKLHQKDLQDRYSIADFAIANGQVTFCPSAGVPLVSLIHVADEGAVSSTPREKGRRRSA
jgi:hypothetical protein